MISIAKKQLFPRLPVQNRRMRYQLGCGLHRLFLNDVCRACEWVSTLLSIIDTVVEVLDIWQGERYEKIAPLNGY